MALAKKDKMNIGILGTIVVLLLLGARLIPNFVNQVSKATNMTPSRTEDIITGITTAGIGTIIFTMSQLFVKGFVRTSWMFGGLILLIEGVGEFFNFSIGDLLKPKNGANGNGQQPG